MTDLVVATFYHFTCFTYPAKLREPLLAQLSAHDLKGTVVLAPEGVNGTLAGPRADIDAALAVLRGFQTLRTWNTKNPTQKTCLSIVSKFV